MNYIDAIIEIGKANNGYIIGEQIREKKIPSIYLMRMGERGLLRRVAQGIYILSDYPDDELYTYALRYKKAIFSRHTALYLNGVLNRQLECIEANFPVNYNTTKINGIKCYRVNQALYELGQSPAVTPGHHIVYIYNIERCICDLFYYDDFDIEEKSYAIKAVDKDGINFDKLFAYAKQMKVLTQVKSIFEVI